MHRIIQITDTHLFAKTHQELLGVNTEESFQAVLKLIEKEKNTDFIIHTGDLSQDHSVEAYLRLAQSLKKIKVPIYHVPGNHDNPKLVEQVYPCDNMVNDKQILIGPWQFILLDTHKPDAVEGYLDLTQLNFLRQCLEAHPKRYTSLFFHHQPIPIANRWLDNLGITNKKDFWATIKNYSQIKAIFFGHIHQEIHQIVNHIPCYSAPSTCIQFKPNQDHFGLDNIPPGYRWIHFNDNGHFDTGVRRAAHYVGHFDENATGY